MALEALKRNGHNLDLSTFAAQGPYSIPIIRPVQLDEKIDWIPFNCANTDRNRESHGIHFFIDDFIYSTYNQLLEGGWRMNEIDSMDMLGFLRVRAWHARQEQKKKEPRKRCIDEVWPTLTPQ